MMHANALDQLRILQLIATEGSFSKAARRLNRSVSTVSYTVAALETQLGVTLFDRSTHTPVITPKGRAVLHEAEVLLRRVDRMEAAVKALNAEVESAVTLAVDNAFPNGVLIDALARLEQVFPTVSVRVRRAPTLNIQQEIVDRRADLGLIAIERGLVWDGVDAREVLAELMLLVAAAEHPLIRKCSPVAFDELENHRQIYLADGWDGGATNDYRVHHTDVWFVDSVETQLGLVERGLGWAFVPEGAAQAALACGRIARVDCSGIVHLPVRRFAACRLITQPWGPVSAWFVNALVRT